MLQQLNWFTPDSALVMTHSMLQYIYIQFEYGCDHVNNNHYTIHVMHVMQDTIVIQKETYN